MHKDYSVIIRCFNEEEHIGRLLSGLLAQTIAPKEIIIVDSGSTDATLSIASRFLTKIVHIAKDDFSFGRALNLGCSHSTSDFLFIVSGHVYPVHKDWSQLMLEPFEDDSIGLVYGKQRGSDLTRFSEHRVFQKWFPEESQNKQKHTFCNNANAVIRQKLWKEIPYDEELTGLEDLDWARKITQKGHCIVYQSKAIVIHIHNETYNKIFNRYYREALALKKIYPEERFGKRELIQLLSSNIFADSYEALKDGKFLRWIKDIFIFRLMQFLGTYHGFNNGNNKISSLKDRFYYPHKIKQKNRKLVARKNLEIDYSQMIDEVPE